MTRTCSDCPAPISRSSKGRCKKCAFNAFHTDPEISARRVANLRAAVGTPEYRAKASAVRLQVIDRLRDDPEFIEKQRRGGKQLHERYRDDPAAQARRAKKHAEYLATEILTWCPADKRADYKALRKKVGADEARRIIEAEISGTAENAKRVVANNALAMQLKHERQQREAY